MRSVIFFEGFFKKNTTLATEIYKKWQYTNHHSYSLTNIFTAASPNYLLEDVYNAYEKTKDSDNIILHSLGAGYFKLLLLNTMIPKHINKTVIIEDAPIESTPTAWQKNVTTATNMEFTEELLLNMNLVLANEKDDFWLKKVKQLKNNKTMIIDRQHNPYTTLQYTNHIAKIANIKKVILLNEKDSIKNIKYYNAIGKFLYDDYNNF